VAGIGSETAVRHIPQDTDRGDDLADRGDTDTTNSACVWIAEATVEGRTYTVRSRHGGANELGRQLVAAGLADRPMVIRYHELAENMTYRSFHAAAMWTFGEGERKLRRVRYRDPPKGGLPWRRDRAKMRFIPNGR
jgi:hypothetical protein